MDDIAINEIHIINGDVFYTDDLVDLKSNVLYFNPLSKTNTTINQMPCFSTEDTSIALYCDKVVYAKKIRGFIDNG